VRPSPAYIQTAFVVALLIAIVIGGTWLNVTHPHRPRSAGFGPGWSCVGAGKGGGFCARDLPPPARPAGPPEIRRLSASEPTPEPERR
jgi:hypothetical protein